MSIGFALVVLATYTAQVAIGFGGTLLALSVGAFLFGDVGQVVTFVVPASLVVTGGLVMAHPEQVRRTLLVRQVLPVMAAGIVVAQLLGPTLVAGGLPLERVYAVFVCGIALRELAGRSRSTVAQWSPARTLFAGGLVHGVFASGGPLVVAALARAGLSKGEFRTTLCALWFVMNGALTLTWIATGRINGESLAISASLVPSMLAALVLGRVVHRVVDEDGFQVVVALGLLMSGLALLLRG